MPTAATTTAGTGGGGVSSRHPLYAEFEADWIQMRDTYRGERVVKEKGTVYLPATQSMEEDGMKNAQADGHRSYLGYKKRAVFPDVVNDAVEAMLGVMHNKPPQIELPLALEPMLEKATLRGEGLDVLLRRINEEQIVTGRTGLLLDLPMDEQAGTVLPYIALYVAETIINWDEGRRDGITVDNLNLVVLDESEFERQRDFSWQYQEKYRVLSLQDPNEIVESTSDGDAENLKRGDGLYYAGVFKDGNANFNFENMVTPNVRGATLNEIPFIFINAKDVVPEPDDPPLLGMSNQALTIYRGEADYRQALFLQGQDTLVVIGTTDENFRTGATSTIILPLGGDAKFIGVDSTGLSEMRTALENDRQTAVAKGGQLLDSTSRQKESGDALKIRVAARTATLNQIALSGAYGLEQLLKIAARWVGANEAEVIVTPNLDFVDDTLGSKDLVDYMTAKSMGAPYSLRSIHGQMRERNLTEMDFEDELAEIATEEPLMGSANEDGPEEDDLTDDPGNTDEPALDPELEPAAE